MHFLLTGLKKFSDDVEEMLGFRPGIYWRICWKFVSPTFIIVSVNPICTCFYYRHRYSPDFYAMEHNFFSILSSILKAIKMLVRKKCFEAVSFLLSFLRGIHLPK